MKKSNRREPEIYNREKKGRKEMEEKGMSYCVAIDGPAGAGKSTIAREIYVFDSV